MNLSLPYSMQRAKTIVCTGFKLIKSINSNKNFPLLKRNTSGVQFIRGLSTCAVKMSYSSVEKGEANSLDYRVFIKSPDGHIVSPFHDIPLFHDKEKEILNMVVEIPRWSNAKMEICKEEKFNPIKQDIKKGKLRFVKNVFPHHGYIWNYGALPQTWEDPNHKEPETGTNGDKDPLDVCEIGHKVHKRGAVIQVKVVGVMCLIDEGETDWKIIVLDVTDPLADEINANHLIQIAWMGETEWGETWRQNELKPKHFDDIDDVERKMPGFIKATYEWFKIYKIPDGKPANSFAFDGEAKNRAYAMRVVKETYEQWKILLAKKVDNCGIACENISVKDSPYLTSNEQAEETLNKMPAFAPGNSLDTDVDRWHYVKL